MPPLTPKQDTWITVVLYGLALGLLLTALQFFQYRWMLLRHAQEWYIGLVALLFAAVGIWAGVQWSRKKSPPPPISPVPAAAPLRPQAEVLEKLGISPRDLEVLQWMACGLSNQEIADRLFVSLNTVKTHASNVFAKLGVQRRTQAIQQAKALGMLS